MEDVLTNNCSEHRRGDERRKQDTWKARDTRDLPLPASHIPKPQRAWDQPGGWLTHSGGAPCHGSADPVSPGWGLSICFQPGQLLALLPWVTWRGKKETPDRREQLDTLGAEHQVSRWEAGLGIPCPACSPLGQLVPVPPEGSQLTSSKSGRGRHPQQ